MDNAWYSARMGVSHRNLEPKKPSQRGADNWQRYREERDIETFREEVDRIHRRCGKKEKAAAEPLEKLRRSLQDATKAGS